MYQTNKKQANVYLLHLTHFPIDNIVGTKI
jgi:hypothetical protein